MCKQVPTKSESGRFTCGCGVSFVWVNGVKGNPEERARFRQIGYKWISVQDGGYYAMSPYPWIYLFADNTWELDPHIEAPELLTEYLDSVEAIIAMR